jgi:hypothetical protein
MDYSGNKGVTFGHLWPKGRSISLAYVSMEGRAMDDIKLEKFVEVLYDQLFAALPPEARRTCPAMRMLDEVLMDLKEANNSEIALELGVTPRPDGTCPCRGAGRRDNKQRKGR